MHIHVVNVYLGKLISLKYVGSLQKSAFHRPYYKQTPDMAPGAGGIEVGHETENILPI